VPGRGTEDGDWVFVGDGEELCFQKVLRKRFPVKCVDDEWGRAWQGVIFTMHCAYRGAENAFVRIGDEIVVERRKDGLGVGGGVGGGALRMVMKKGFDDPLMVGWIIAGLVFALLSQL